MIHIAYQREKIISWEAKQNKLLKDEDEFLPGTQIFVLRGSCALR